MANTRAHHALPAPVVHAGFSVSQSKSTVLAGVRDAYWSEEEDVSGFAVQRHLLPIDGNRNLG
jgi:hypothetical protein